MNDVVYIGRCIGCDQVSRLDDGVCRQCLSHPKRGRRWAEMAHRCRVDREFAASIYSRIRTEYGRELFRRVFGEPTAHERSRRTSGGPDVH